MKKIILPLIIGFMIIQIITSACQNRKDRLKKEDQKSEKIQSTNNNKNKLDGKIAKATFFLENSGSMFGYLSSNSNYVQAVNNLALNLDFSDMNTETSFNLINGNGEDVKITDLGNNPKIFKSLLNMGGFNKGNIHTSDLTKMFEIALKNASSDSISILVSDGLYDVGGEASPLNALDAETSSTALKFNERIRQNPNLQTLIIKLTSNFEGRYTILIQRRIC